MKTNEKPKCLRAILYHFNIYIIKILKWFLELKVIIPNPQIASALLDLKM